MLWEDFLFVPITHVLGSFGCALRQVCIVFKTFSEHGCVVSAIPSGLVDVSELFNSYEIILIRSSSVGAGTKTRPSEFKQVLLSSPCETPGHKSEAVAIVRAIHRVALSGLPSAMGFSRFSIFGVATSLLYE